MCRRAWHTSDFGECTLRKKTWILASLSALLLATSVDLASADTLREALAKAYANSQSLKRCRAQLRATDENVPQARAGLRPVIRGVVNTQASRSRTTFGDNLPKERNRTGAITGGIQINQTLFDGFRRPTTSMPPRLRSRGTEEPRHHGAGYAARYRDGIHERAA